MANLKGTKTEKNLMEAFVDESVVRNKYTFFAAEARKDGYEQVAEFFEKAADNEKEHAKVWYRLLYEGKTAGTAENLKAAIGYENKEWTEKYKQMAEDARNEGFDNIAFLLESIGAVEKEHEKSFKELLQKVEDNSFFNKTEKASWVCRICGYATDDDNAPEKCPVCEHPKSYFELKRKQ